MRFAPLVLLFLSTTASAHIEMTSPMPRSLAQKEGPCGAPGSTRGDNVTVFQPGETITVTWDETVDHPGHYRLAFDDDGDDDFPNPNNPDDNFASTMVEPIADKVGGSYSQQVTLPTTPCDNCTLQLVQVMTTRVPYDSFYFQCADLVIAGDPTDPGGDPGGGCSTSGGAGAGMLLAVLMLVRRQKRE
jgi:uncharacterized protein (TIGR03382 family)